MRIRILMTIALTLAAVIPVEADGEYARFHVGPYVALGWSPSQEYRDLKGTLPGTQDKLLVEGNAAFALNGGLGGTYSLHPSQVRIGLDLDFIRTMGKGGGIPTARIEQADGTVIAGSRVAVTQTALRGTFKLIYSFRPNTYPAWYTFVGSTVSRITTNVEVSDLGTMSETLCHRKTHLNGWVLGVGHRSLGENASGIFEIGLYYQSQQDVQAGGLTFEIKGGIQF